MDKFSIEIMEKIEIPKEAQKLFIALSEKLNKNQEYLSCRESYDGSDIQSENMVAVLEEVAAKEKENYFSVCFTFLMESIQKMYDKYIEKGIDTGIFYETIKDFKYKFDECLEIKEVYGTFVPNWFRRFYRVDRFTFGRFQYETVEFPYDSYEKDGVVIKKGDTVLNIHIPSSGAMDKRVREESYKEALDFYKKTFNITPKAFVCNSWLLNPDHGKFLPEGSNIIGFLKEFDIICEKTDEEFNDAWRIFGKDAELPLDKLPNNTSLQKAYVRWLKEGNFAKTGYGVKIIK